MPLFLLPSRQAFLILQDASEVSLPSSNLPLLLPSQGSVPPEFPGCPGPASTVTLPDYNYQFKFLLFPQYCKPFLGFYVFLCKSQKLAQCLAPEQT